jgi:hypothetical protein
MKTLLTLLILAVLPAVAHDHYAAGIVDTNGNGQPNAGEPLQFIGPNGSGKIFHLLARPTGQRPTQRCGGYYMLDERPRTLFPNDSFSFITVSDGQYDANTTGHAHTGAWIWMEIVSVSGPSGGNFGFWEEDWSASNDTPSRSFPANQPTGNYRFILSEGFDDVGEDPFGHIHGRSWTADKPGTYIVGFRLVDLSTNGPGGGPWHTPSQIYYFNFQAGPSFQHTMQRSGNSAILTWPSQLGYYAADTAQTGIVFTVQRTTSLSPATWTNIGTVTGTTANTATFTDPSPPTGNAFYRLRWNWSVANP